MHTIFDTLTGRYADGDDVSEYSSSEAVLKSVRSHLLRLLNARQDVLQHLPDYGIPDVNKFYQALPYSERDMAYIVKQTIEKYEPRLKHVRVLPKPRDLQRCVVRLEISGEIIGAGRIRFQTLFRSSGEVTLTQLNGG